MNHWYSVDPGLSGCGIAAFTDGTLLWYANYYPKGKTFVEKSDDFCAKLTLHISPYSTVFCEWPTYQTVVAQNTGSIIKLAYLIGRIAHIGKVTLVPVNKWKGNLPKEVVQFRAEKFFGHKGFKAHAADAVGIGMYCIQAGIFN